MKVVKQTADYTVYERRDGRFSVKNKKKRPVNGEEKVKILLAEGLIKLSVAQEKPAEEAPAEAAEAAEGEEAAE